MVLSNAERQARYRERLKALAAAAQMSEAQAALLQSFRRRILEAQNQIAYMREGRFSLFETLADGSRRDLTPESIADNEAAIGEYERLLELFDPEGVTVLEESSN